MNSTSLVADGIITNCYRREGKYAWAQETSVGRVLKLNIPLRTGKLDQVRKNSRVSVAVLVFSYFKLWFWSLFLPFGIGQCPLHFRFTDPVGLARAQFRGCKGPAVHVTWLGPLRHGPVSPIQSTAICEGTICLSVIKCLPLNRGGDFKHLLRSSGKFEKFRFSGILTRGKVHLRSQVASLSCMCSCMVGAAGCLAGIHTWSRALTFWRRNYFLNFKFYHTLYIKCE